MEKEKERERAKSEKRLWEKKKMGKKVGNTHVYIYCLIVLVSLHFISLSTKEKKITHPCLT